MKFSDGVWRSAKGMAVATPHHLWDVAVTETEIRVDASSCPYRGRFEDQETKYFTVRLHAPAPNVIGVTFVHHSGGIDRGPAFELFPDPAVKPAIVNEADFVSLSSGDLTVRVEKRGDWRLDVFRAGKRITGSALGAGGYAVNADERKSYVFERLDLGVGELVYGLGERFTAFTRNGQSVEIWNRDGGTSTEQAYKNIPFFLTNRGWGVLVDQPDRVSFEVGSEFVSKVGFSVEGESLAYLLIDGPTPKDVLDRYTRLTGRPALPPAWSFGLWLTTSFTTEYDEKTVSGFVDGMRERDIPLHVFHFDCFWMREFNWCDFEWDARTFPDPAGMLRRLHDRGLKVSVWINPYIAQRSPLFEEARRLGCLLKRPNGDVWQRDQWQPGMGIVDFTNPAARDWFSGHLRRLVGLGVDCFKTDFGERIPTDVVYHDGSDPVKMHNFYPIAYNETVFSTLEKIKGEGEAIVFARSAFATGQRFPVHWGGDCYSTFESMAESLRGGLSFGLCGFGFWSHDIGGFEGQSPAAIYKRWVAFGLLSSHSRLHGSSTYRVPWSYDDEACDVLRFFTKLKCRLMPYLFGAAVQAHHEGIPVMRAMTLEFPGDPACDTLDRQYSLGGSLLVAPVFSEDGWVDYYLPEGRWTHLLSGEVQTGGRWHRARHAFLSLPLFVRPGTVLPLGAVDARPDYEFTDGITFRAYEIAEGATAKCSVPARNGGPGVEVSVTRRGRRLHAELAGTPAGTWGLQAGPNAAIVQGAAGALRLEADLPA